MNRRELLGAAVLTLGAEAVTKAVSWAFEELTQDEIYVVWCAGHRFDEGYDERYAALTDACFEAIPSLHRRGYLARCRQTDSPDWPDIFYTTTPYGHRALAAAGYPIEHDHRALILNEVS